MAEKKMTQKTIQVKQADSEKRLALWLIGKANTASYRAGSGKNGSIHPKINGKVYEAVVDNIIHHLKIDGKFNENEITFYFCKYLGDDNLCSRYETRLDLCKHCPSTPWSIVPPGCGFEGWLFWQREEVKQKIRLAKEELLELKLLKLRTKDEETLGKISLVEQKIHRNIDMYKKFGSENW